MVAALSHSTPFFSLSMMPTYTTTAENASNLFCKKRARRLTVQVSRSPHRLDCLLLPCGSHYEPNGTILLFKWCGFGRG